MFTHTKSHACIQCSTLSQVQSQVQESHWYVQVLKELKWKYYATKWVNILQFQTPSWRKHATCILEKNTCIQMQIETTNCHLLCIQVSQHNSTFPTCWFVQYESYFQKKINAFNWKINASIRQYLHQSSKEMQGLNWLRNLTISFQTTSMTLLSAAFHHVYHPDPHQLWNPIFHSCQDLSPPSSNLWMTCWIQSPTLVYKMTLLMEMSAK